MVSLVFWVGVVLLVSGAVGTGGSALVNGAVGTVLFRGSGGGSFVPPWTTVG